MKIVGQRGTVPGKYYGIFQICARAQVIRCGNRYTYDRGR